MNDMSETSKELFALLQEYTKKSIDNWMQNSLFTWQWWLGIILAFVPWIIWIYFRDKKSTNRLLYVGFLQWLLHL